MKQLTIDEFLNKAPALTVRRACDKLKNQKALALAHAIEEKIGKNSRARMISNPDSKTYSFELTLPLEHPFLIPGLRHLAYNLYVDVNSEQKSAVVSSIYHGRHCSELLSKLNGLLNKLLEELDKDGFFNTRSFFDLVNFIIDLEDGRFILVDSEGTVLI